TFFNDQDARAAYVLDAWESKGLHYAWGIPGGFGEALATLGGGCVGVGYDGRQWGSQGVVRAHTRGECKPGPTRMIGNATVVDQRTGRTLTGTVDIGPTIDRIKSGGSFPHRNDGAVFRNHPLPGKTTPELPSKPAGYYREYVHPTPGVRGPGPQRIVVGQGGDMHYTPDHYTTFVPLTP
ncbi:MAG: hypothetical protein GY832_25115, partial [Chloroflexi bacterium]|nr:hypothetical protein [Chloroflexota bacterium]